MLIRFTPAGDVASLSRLLHDVASAPRVGLLLVLACDGNEYTPEEIDPVLRAAPKPVIGGIFPYLVHGMRILEFGTLVIGLACTASTFTLRQHDTPPARLRAQTSAAGSDAKPAPRSLLMFMDGRAADISALLDASYEAVGVEVDCLGAAAGSLTLVQKPCVISNEGLLENAAVLALTDIRAGIGVAHGWIPIGAEIEVTEAERNVVRRLNGRPAAAVYQEIIQAHSGHDFTHTAFSEISKAYPLGIVAPDGRLQVRDPVAADDGNLVCIGDVPAGSRVRILHGEVEDLVDATAHAHESARANFPDATPASAWFVIESVSRALLLQDDVKRELAGADVSRIGILSLGEIASTADRRPAFHNKACVLGLLDA